MRVKPIIEMVIVVFLLPFLAIAQEVRVEPNTKTTIELGTTMDITTGNLILESDATGDASLIVRGAVEINNGGKTQAERYLPGSALVWRMLGSPVGGMAITGSEFAPGDGEDLYAWDEPSPGTWINYKGTNFSAPTVNNGDNFLSGKGYLVAYDETNPTKIFSGDLNIGNVTFTLKNSGGKGWDYSEGWNFMSNPYSSSIDWNAATRTQFQDEYAYIYDPNKEGGEGYVSINGSNVDAFIGSNQGFFVLAKTTSDNDNFTFTTAMQTHAGGTYLKALNADNELVLRLSSDNYYDETTLVLSEESSFDRDRNDALKMYSFNSSIPQLYSISQDEVNLDINSFPEISDETPIPLGIRIPESGAYTVSLQNGTTNYTSNTLYLEDKLTNNLHKISEEAYAFISPQGDIDNRFVLHFGMTAISENEMPELLNIWAYNNELCIVSEVEQAQLEIFDMQGRRISVKTITINGKYSEMLTLVPGVYVVRLQSSSRVESKQIIVN